MTRRQLCLRPPLDNQFARLSANVAQELFQQAVQEATAGSAHDGWQAASAQEGSSASGVDFLPLEITLEGGVTIYVSHNGGVIETEGVVELPHSAVSPSVESGCFVEVRPLSFVPNAVTIEMEPLTTEDWEMLELSAGFLESGSLLSQVSLVYPGQVLTLRLGGSDTASLRVLGDDGACRRLLADTEIIITPKPRPKPPAPSPPLRLAGTSNDWSKPLKSLARQHGVLLQTVSPGCMMIHPKTLRDRIPGWSDSGDQPQHAVVWRADDEAGLDTFVTIRSSENIPEDVVALHILNRYTIHATPLHHSIRVQLIPLDVVERIQRRTMKRLESGEVQVHIERLVIEVDEGEEWKPWRECKTSGLAEPPELASMPHDVLVTEDSILLLKGGNWCNRVVTESSSRRVDKSGSRTPSLIFAVKDAHNFSTSVCQSSCSIVQTDGHFTMMPATRHCLIDAEWTQQFLEKWDCNDAWFIQGDVGTGKTHYSLVIAALARMKWSMPTTYVDCKTLQSAPDLRMNSILRELTQAFRAAVNSQPSVLILDDLDLLAASSKGDGGANLQQINPIEVDQSKLIAKHVQTLMESCRPHVIFVMTCRSVKALASEITDSLVCYQSYEMGALNPLQRTNILRSMLALDDETKGFHSVSSLSEGYRAHDLEVVATRVKHAHSDNKEHVVEVLRHVVGDYVPLCRQGLVSEAKIPTANWSDIGGLFHAKEKLKNTILDPVKYRRIYEKAPIKLPKGILLFGPPGCGKTFIVPALAKECGHTLIACRGPELLDRYIGASEANVRRLFERARGAAPSILFLDEFDALAPRRGSDHTGVTDRVVNQLLTYLDGVETTMEGVFIIASTSRPDKLDPALLRPGRLEQHVFVGFPQSWEELNDVVAKTMLKRRIADSLIHSIESNSFEWSQEEKNRLQQLSPADIKAVLDTAHLETIHEHLASPSDAPLMIQEAHFRAALRATRPSVSTQDLAMFDHIYRPFLASSRDSYEKKTTPQELRTALK